MGMHYEFKREDAYNFARRVGARTNIRGDELQFMFCPYCHGGAHKDTWTFSINLVEGVCRCFRSTCQCNGGNMITLSRDFDFDLGFKFDEYYRPKKKYKSFPNRKPEEIKPKPPALEYLAKRGISEQVAEKYQITVQANNPEILVIPHFNEMGELKTVKYRNVNYQKGVSHGAKEWFEKDCMPILFGMYQCNPETEEKQLVFTEGQIDALSVAEAGIENAVSVPNGANGFTWKPYCWDFLEKYDKYVIFGDHENGKITLVDEMKTDFRDKIRVVREEDYKGCKDANELLQKYGKEAVRAAVENAQPLPILRVVELADVELVDVFKIEKLKTGLRNLDKLLYGGIPFGGVTIISGKPGEGKSTLASQILVQAMERNYRCFAYSGELPNGVFKGWMNYQVAGPSHVFIWQNEFGDENYNISNTNQMIISEWYRGRIEIYDHSILDEDLSEKESLVKTCEAVIRRHGAQVILIDNLMTAIDLEEERGSDKYERQAQFVKKLGRIAQRYGVLILLVAHKRKNNFSMNENDEVAGASEIVNLAMVTIAYERIRKKDGSEENDDDGESQRLIKVSKNRLFGKTNTKGWTVDFEPRSKRIYEAGIDDPTIDLSWAKATNGFEQMGADPEQEIPFD